PKKDWDLSLGGEQSHPPAVGQISQLCKGRAVESRFTCSFRFNLSEGRPQVVKSIPSPRTFAPVGHLGPLVVQDDLRVNDQLLPNFAVQRLPKAFGQTREVS